MRLDDPRAGTGQQRGDSLGLTVVDHDDRHAVFQHHRQGHEKPRVHEGHMDRVRLLTADEADQLLLRTVTPAQGQGGVDDQFGHAGGARGVRHQRWLVAVQLDRGTPRRAGQRVQRDRAGEVAARHDDAGGHLFEWQVRDLASDLRLVGEEVGPLQPIQQRPDRRPVQGRGEEHRHRPDPGRGAGQDVDVEVVGLVQRHVLAGPDSGGPQPRRHVVDQFRECREGEFSSHFRC